MATGVNLGGIQVSSKTAAKLGKTPTVSKNDSAALQKLAAQTGGTIKGNRVEYKAEGPGYKATRYAYAGDTPDLSAPEDNPRDTMGGVPGGAEMPVDPGSVPQNGTPGLGAGATPGTMDASGTVLGPSAPGLAGVANAAAPTPTQNKYQQGLASAQAGGITAPQDAGAARSLVSAHIPYTPDTTGVDNYISTDPAINQLMSGITQLLNPQQQTSTLMQDYNSLYKKSGLDKINEELIDADTVINGTEDDIRNEIQTAGGFGTESQVQAMALSRNKGLLKRYNQLVQMKTDATNQLNTLSSLNAQDKQMAQTKLNTQINGMFQLANFAQQAQNNTREAFNNIVAKVGYAGAYQAYAQDPRQLGFIEQTMGLQPGGLKSLAAQPDLDRQIKQAQLANEKASTANIYDQVRARNDTTSSTKPQTQAQVVAQGYAQRANEANQVISKLGGQFTSPLAIGGFLPTALQGADRQAYEQAKRQFINSVLRPESGASISPSEFASAEKEYFPGQGDSAQAVLNKAVDRQLKINSLQTQGATQSVAEAGQVIEYQGKQYTVDANGDMTAI